MLRLIVLALCVVFSAPKIALAEGGTCPPGYYPVNSPGVSGCAPIPGYGGGQDPVATGPSWMSTWGAIATDNSVSAIGSVTRQSSKRQAQRNAVKSCRANGGTNKCKVSLAYYNQCGVMAIGDSFAVTHGAGTVEEASKAAIARCSRETQNCRVILSECSYPVRVN
jgi:Domain of unknown function (DUF4189)